LECGWVGVGNGLCDQLLVVVRVAGHLAVSARTLEPCVAVVQRLGKQTLARDAFEELVDDLFFLKGEYGVVA
jgi:hypothetical protein